MEKPGFYAILPSPVRYDRRLSASEKVFFAEITALSDQCGYCYAGNGYFSELYDTSDRTVQRWVKHLQELGYVAVTKEISEALEIPIEVLEKNFSTSYSAARGALNEFWRTCEMQRSWFADKFCQPIYEMWLDEAVSRGRVKAPGYFTDPAVAGAYSACKWNGPARTNLNPIQEVTAAEKRIALGISKYFYRVDHAVLLEILGRRITDPDVMTLLERVINNPNEPFGLPRGKKPEDVAFESWLYNVGMPIGNLLSQMFANIVLNELDQYCKHVLKIHCYIRYMDDILVLGPDKEQLKQCHAAIAAFLSEMLHLDLNAKTCIRPVSMGIEFVGQRVWATHCVLRKSTVRRMKREVRKISEDVRDGVITGVEYQRRVASIRGMMDHTNSGALRWRLNEITLNIVGEEYGQLPYGRGDSDRKAVRGGGAAKRDHPRAA